MLIYSNDSIFSIGCLNICSSSVRLCSHSRYRRSRYNQFFYVEHYFHVHPLAATRKSRCQKLVTALCQCKIQEICLNMRCHVTILDTRQSRATGFSFLFFPAYFVVCAFFILLSEFFFCRFIVNEWGITHASNEHSSQELSTLCVIFVFICPGGLESIHRRATKHENSVCTTRWQPLRIMNMISPVE